MTQPPPAPSPLPLGEPPRQAWTELIGSIGRALHERPLTACTGKVQEVVGTLIRAVGVDAQIGELCELRRADGSLLQRAEVVGFARESALLSPFGPVDGLSRSTQVHALGRPLSIQVGEGLVGRVVDSLGEPLDGRGVIAGRAWRSAFGEPPNPMARPLMDTALETGVRAVDGLLTLGIGQRIGIFAPAGAGKSTLLGMLARGARCDINVIALIGERGREVREFISQTLGEEGMARSVVVCATSDRSAIERAKAAHIATAIAEDFRDQGKHVLLMMDSLTRYARAQREIGLAAGEPPTRRGFPPSTFAELPRLLERTGLNEKGAITAVYTVLAEDESGDDPVAEEVRGLLDGHVVLSREIAARNHYPAIDVLASLSRVMPQVVAPSHQRAAGRLRSLMARHREVETLVQIGEYQAGSDPLADQALARHGAIQAFLAQRTDEFQAFDDTFDGLALLADLPR